MKAKPKWQHVIPQGFDTGHDGPVAPKRVQPGFCVTCGAPIVKVADNEGPEGLKALLRF